MEVGKGEYAGVGGERWHQAQRCLTPAAQSQRVRGSAGAQRLSRNRPPTDDGEQEEVLDIARKHGKELISRAKLSSSFVTLPSLVFSFIPLIVPFQYGPVMPKPEVLLHNTLLHLAHLVLPETYSFDLSTTLSCVFS